MALQISDEGSSEPLLTTNIRQAGTHASIALTGELDISMVGSLYDQFAGLAQQGVCHVSVDMGEVTFMDSTGLSLLVSEHKRSESMGGELIIFCPSEQLRRLFQLTGLDSYLNIRPKEASF